MGEGDGTYRETRILRAALKCAERAAHKERLAMEEKTIPKSPISSWGGERDGMQDSIIW